MQSEINKCEAPATSESAQNTDGQLKESLQLCQDELGRVKDAHLRSVAELENFKRRVQSERSQWRNAAQAELFLKLVAIVDDFDRALEVREGQERNAAFDAWLEGFKIIRNELQKLLATFDVARIDATDVFDPELHEAVVQVESDKHEAGHIVQVFEHGYMLKGTLLRPAKVSVAK